MSRRLATLLGNFDPSLQMHIMQLEKTSGGPSIDIRLMSEININVRSKLHELNLDPSDTTPSELFAALKLRFADDSKRLESALNKIHSPVSMSSLAQILDNYASPKACFAIKKSIAKRILKTNVPKVTLKNLGYRSIDSLIKHESPAAIIMAATVLEPYSWQKSLEQAYEKLKPSDFESRSIEFFVPKTKQWTKLASSLADSQRTTILVCKEMGTLGLLSAPDKMPNVHMTNLLLGLQAINNIRIYSAYCKLEQVKPDFGSLVARSKRGSFDSPASIVGLPLPWRIIQKYFSRFSSRYPAELFEPHVQQNDLMLISYEDVLADIEETLEFWRGTSWLAFEDNGEVVSFNLTDNAINSSNNLSYEQRYIDYCRDEIWNELLIRYLKERQVEESICRQLDAQLMENNFEADANLSLGIA